MKKMITMLLVLTIFTGLTACNGPKGQNGELNKNDGPVEIGVYDMYDLETYTRPIWNDRVIIFLGNVLGKQQRPAWCIRLKSHHE